MGIVEGDRGGVGGGERVRGGGREGEGVYGGDEIWDLLGFEGGPVLGFCSLFWCARLRLLLRFHGEGLGDLGFRH